MARQVGLQSDIGFQNVSMKRQKTSVFPKKIGLKITTSLLIDRDKAKHGKMQN